MFCPWPKFRSGSWTKQECGVPAGSVVEPADCCGELSRGNLGGNNWPLSRCWFRSIEWCGGGGTRQPCYATLLLDYNMFLSIMCIFLSHFRGWQSSVKIKKHWREAKCRLRSMSLLLNPNVQLLQTNLTSWRISGRTWSGNYEGINVNNARKSTQRCARYTWKTG